MPTTVELEVTNRLLDKLRAHDANEDALLNAYRSLANADPDDGIRYLAGLIAEDEERHHRLLAEMAERVETWRRAEGDESGTPHLSPRIDRALLETTRQLIKSEREDAKELRRLRRELHNAGGASLLPLMVELMLRDTAKHIEILRFIRTYTG